MSIRDGIVLVRDARLTLSSCWLTGGNGSQQLGGGEEDLGVAHSVCYFGALQSAPA